MPTYEYECLKCGQRFDYFQKMTDEPIKICLQCSGEVKRIISGGGGFLFKGTGFYASDYRSKSYVEAEKKEIGYKEPTPKKPDKEVKSEK